VFSVLESVLHGVLDIPYLMVGLLVTALNGWIGAIGLLAAGLVAVLPGFPSVPTIPAGPAGAVAYFLPVGSVLAVFVVMLVAWATFMGLKIALNWGKVKM
jgi:hypothetical protein